VVEGKKMLARSERSCQLSPQQLDLVDVPLRFLGRSIAAMKAYFEAVLEYHLQVRLYARIFRTVIDVIGVAPCHGDLKRRAHSARLLLGHDLRHAPIRVATGQQSFDSAPRCSCGVTDIFLSNQVTQHALRSL